MYPFLCQKRFYNWETNIVAFCVRNKCLSIPLPFFKTQIINPFLNSIILSNRKILPLLFIYCRISLPLTNIWLEQNTTFFKISFYKILFCLKICKRYKLLLKILFSTNKTLKINLKKWFLPKSTISPFFGGGVIAKRK